MNSRSTIVASPIGYRWIAYLVFTILLGQNMLHAQEAPNDPEYPLVVNPHSFNLGVGVGVATMYGDLNKHLATLGYRAGIGKHISNSLVVGVEYYAGTLSSKETPNTWTSGLQSSTSFNSVDVNGKVNLSVFFSNKDSRLIRFLSGFYIGSGVGIVSVKVLNITESLFVKKPNTGSLKNEIQMQDTKPYIPLNIGYRYRLRNVLANRSSIMLNYNMCCTYSDYMDGYNLSNIGSNKNDRFTDMYGLFTVGFSFALTGGRVLGTEHHSRHADKPKKHVSDEEAPEEPKKAPPKPQPKEQPGFVPKIID